MAETHEATDAGAHGGTETAGHGGGTGGLPQFDPTWWPGQIVWLLIIFVVVLAFMRLFAVPRLGGTIAARDEQINGDIEAARRLKAEAGAQSDAAAAELTQTRAAGMKLAQDASAKAQGEISARLAEEEAKLSATIGKAEASIAAAREKAMGSVQGIATETAQAIIEKLTGKAAAKAEVDATQGSRG